MGPPLWVALAGRAWAPAMPVLRAHLPSVCRRVQSLFHSVQLNVNNPHFLIMQGRITKARRQQTVGGLGLAQACTQARIASPPAGPFCPVLQILCMLACRANGLQLSTTGVPAWPPCFAT